MATILLVEDDEQVRKLVSKRLKAAGHTVTSVRDAEAALAQFGSKAPDVVVTDLVLPGKDGQALITDLLLRAPETRIIAISGAADQDVQALLQEASLRGAVRALTKPFTTDQLLEAVDAALAG